MSNLAQNTLLAFTLLLVAGCGQMGPLYLPVEDTGERPATETPATGAPLESEPAGNAAGEEAEVDQPQDDSSDNDEG